MKYVLMFMLLLLSGIAEAIEWNELSEEQRNVLQKFESGDSSLLKEEFDNKYKKLVQENEILKREKDESEKKFI